ncbi:MAG: ATP-dependent 6-phosphofructokinase [Sandaracinaceae bacterium]|nr:ATP-dependent 6-phosphofructokinase [Sandaracinaceae bacterium]
MLKQDELAVPSLGPCEIPSPIPDRELFVEEDDGVLVHGDALDIAPYVMGLVPPPAFEPAGPREKIFFDPKRTTAAVVTCGGLCPGVNDVLRAIFLTLKFRYGVERLLGVRYGYSGLAKDTPHPPIELSMEVVRRIHEDGGTILASSRGAPPVAEMVDSLVRLGVSVLFTIGGDGTQRGAAALAEEIALRGLPIAVVGVPKTIDNDIHWVERTFGFATAVDEACRAIMGAHVEAKGAFNGVGLVKLMGRHSGFIAAHASLANSDVNFCFVPEVPLVLDGPRGFLAVLEERLARAQHALIVVAEGAGQDLFDAMDDDTDASGNAKLRDIGVHLRDRIVEHFAKRKIPLTLKYIDPSYLVRSLPANAFDSALCLMMGQHAVHAAMAGRTSAIVGYWNQRFTQVPIALAIKSRKQLDARGELWQAVLSATGQPARWE